MLEIQAAGGEGLIARRPGVPFSGGRSADILKVKRAPLPARPTATFCFEFAL
jgi:ATP-dependent DNA ligase